VDGAEVESVAAISTELADGERGSEMVEVAVVVVV
jgi:hypothetical protein